MNPLVDPFAVALGADRVISLHTDASAGPLSWVQLREEVGRRLASHDRQAEAPSWDVRRLIPFRVEVWHELVQLASKLRQHGTSVSPDELAAIFLECHIETFKKTLKGA